MTFKDKINHLIDDDPMGPILIPLGMLAAALIFLIMAICIWECYDTWYNDTYVTEVSRSEPADGIVTEYGEKVEHGYKTIYDDRRVWTGKAYVTKRVSVGSEPYDIIHKYIKYAVYSNIDDLYHETGWVEVGWKMKPGYVYGKFQVVTYYDSHKDETTVKIERVN
jgi:hypothetical protein